MRFSLVLSVCLRLFFIFLFFSFDATVFFFFFWFVSFGCFVVTPRPPSSWIISRACQSSVLVSSLTNDRQSYYSRVTVVTRRPRSLSPSTFASFYIFVLFSILLLGSETLNKHVANL